LVNLYNSEKYKIRTTSNDNIDLKVPSKTLILEKQNNSDSSDDEKDNTIKLSRFSSRISKKDDVLAEQFDYDRTQVTIKHKVRELVHEIIDKALSKMEKDDDDYFKLIDIRNNQRSSTQLPQSINSKFANKFMEYSKIRIYLLNTQQYYDITLGMADTVKDVKNKVLAYLRSNSRFKLKYDIPEGDINLCSF
jgi:hypothetical protein